MKQQTPDMHILTWQPAHLYNMEWWYLK